MTSLSTAGARFRSSRSETPACPSTLSPGALSTTHSRPPSAAGTTSSWSPTRPRSTAPTRCSCCASAQDRRRNLPNPPTITYRRNFLRQILASNLRHRFHQPRQNLRRAAAQAEVAYLRDLGFVEIHFDQSSAALLHLERKSRRRINRRGSSRHDHEV